VCCGTRSEVKYLRVDRFLMSLTTLFSFRSTFQTLSEVSILFEVPSRNFELPGRETLHLFILRYFPRFAVETGPFRFEDFRFPLPESSDSTKGEPVPIGCDEKSTIFPPRRLVYPQFPTKYWRSAPSTVSPLLFWGVVSSFPLPLQIPSTAAVGWAGPKWVLFRVSGIEIWIVTSNG